MKKPGSWESSEIWRLAKDCAVKKWMRPHMALPSSMRNAGDTATRVRVIEELEAQTHRRVLNRPSASGDGGASQSGLGNATSQLAMSQSGSQPGQRMHSVHRVSPEDT